MLWLNAGDLKSPTPIWQCLLDPPLDQPAFRSPHSLYISSRQPNHLNLPNLDLDSHPDDPVQTARRRPLLTLAFACLFVLSPRQPARAASPPATDSAPASDLARIVRDFNLPPSYAQLLEDRLAIDAYQQRHYRVEPGGPPAPVADYLPRGRNEKFVRVVVSQPAPEILRQYSALPTLLTPVRGYRAPILQAPTSLPAVTLDSAQLSPKERLAADHLEQNLAQHGLLPTLAHLIELLGPASLAEDPWRAARTLERIGFPVDLLAFFHPPPPAASPLDPPAILAALAGPLAQGQSLTQVLATLDSWTFRFRPTDPQFRGANEDGEHELGLIRMQAGGGLRQGGVVPGDSIDVICQLVSAMPQADFLISIPQEFLEPMVALARRTWRLRRVDQATFVGEPFTVAMWAQDNGKAGWLEAPDGPSPRLATLAPRYACLDEGRSSFAPGESLLMQGLAAAGHSIIPSPLLFQGGNVLVVHDPVRRRRLLLLGEGEVCRNVALGLTQVQVLEAFRQEFGVDDCLVWPAVSYHLDFDVCVGRFDQRLVAFVNDPLAAARTILALGLSALAQAGWIEPAQAGRWQSDLAADRTAGIVGPLRERLRQALGERAVYPASVAAAFKTARADDAAGNLQTFLLALDWLENGQAALPALADDPERARYLQALRRMEEGRRRQRAVLAGLGWDLHDIPSIMDLYRGINYLNGIHHRQGYLLPAMGGFYEPLDRQAQAAFQRVLGPAARIVPIQTAECQRKQGSVHCLAAPYPRLRNTGF